MDAIRSLLARAAAEFGTPLYVYSLPLVRDRLAMIERAFGGDFQVSYAVKSNPNHELLRRLKSIVTHLDVSSAGELRRALSAGFEASAVTFTGPGKTNAELRAAVAARIDAVIVESLSEAAVLNRFAAEAGVRQGVLLRIAPSSLPKGFGVNMAGRPTQFGVDEEAANAVIRALRDFSHLSFDGFHIFAGTQCLVGASIAANYDNCAQIFRRFAAEHQLRPRMLVFGSSLGIPYHEGDSPLDLAQIGESWRSIADGLRSDSHTADSQWLLEMGRYLVGEAGFYLTRVTRRKSSRGVEIAVMDGGMNHNLAACGHLGGVIHRNYRFIKISGSGAGAAESLIDLVGPLCTSIDTLGHRVKLPGLEEGDIVAMHCCGAYGLTASPVHFISHAPPREILVEGEGDRLTFVDVTESAAERATWEQGP